MGLVHGASAYTAVPLPGSATYANEAVIAALVPAGGKLAEALSPRRGNHPDGLSRPSSVPST